MKSYLLFLFGVGALWDVATTVFGTWILFDNRALAPLLASIAFGLVILGIMGSTIWIWKTDGIWGLVFKCAWIAALVYDVFTSWKGNYDLLFGQNIVGLQFVLLISLTAFMTLSPILWVYIYGENKARFE